MAKEPTLLFCVGAAKAGTSWLYQYLAGHPDVHLRSIKELHYFDALDLDQRQGRIRMLNDQIVSYLKKSVGAPEARQVELQQKISDCNDLLTLHQAEADDPAGYLEYLQAGRGTEAVVADITPAYGLLSSQRLAQMAGLGGKTRFIYILRDPVARLWSHIRMIAGRKARSDADFVAETRRQFWAYGRGERPDVWARSDYRGTLEKLSNALDPSCLLVLFFEDLFSEHTKDKICGFLGIRQMQFVQIGPVNTGRELQMKIRQRNQARLWLAPQYDDVRARFDTLPTAWLDNMPGDKT